MNNPCETYFDLANQAAKNSPRDDEFFARENAHSASIEARAARFDNHGEFHASTAPVEEYDGDNWSDYQEENWVEITEFIVRKPVRFDGDFTTQMPLFGKEVA